MADILVVDDEKNICLEFQGILEEFGHRVDIAHHGKQALKKVENKKYDVVFLDIMLPHMEGREVFDRMKAIRNLPIVFMSGYMNPGKEEDAKKRNVLACLKKPLDLQEVKNILARIDQ
jgi:CheY-like chemotaxis protein